ncbi:MAG: leucine-rich repeat protein [Firmicutes bacterium]|nr:leucine-rich repeat protein [Bacillota bacterium]
MAKENFLTKMRKKVDKEFAAELAAQEKADEKARKKEEALAAYKEDRALTVRKFFEIAGLDFPADFEHMADHPVSYITADSRKVTPDSIFMYWGSTHPAKYSFDPLKTAMGADFLLMITDTPCGHPNQLVITGTDDEGNSLIRNAYSRAIHHIRRLHKAKIITVTGSVGKTSTKEMIESVLRAHYKNPVVSKGNNNSFFAVARYIQNLKYSTNVYLQEVGASTPKTIEFSARQLDADICVYTNIGVSHIESYGGREKLIEDKLSLSTYGNPDGLAIINYDDEALMNHRFTQKVVTYSLNNPGASYYAENIISDGTGYNFEIVSAGSGEKFPARVNALGEHNILNAVCAFAVGRALNLKAEKILSGIASYAPSGMRQNMLEVGDYHIFADCYNSSLMAVDNTLSAMDQMTLPAEKGRRIAALGDVLELGDISEDTHRQMGKCVAEHKVDLLLAYGHDIRFAVEEACAAGLEARYFSDRKDFEAALRENVTKDDIVLFKASHGVNIGASMDRLFGTDINESTSIGHHEYQLITEGDFEFYVFENSASVKKYLGESPVTNVPAFIEADVEDHFLDMTVRRSLPVEKIGKTAFRGMKHVKEVILPETVVRIRDGAFKGSGLTNFTAPASLLTVGEEAFADCADLVTVTLPETVREVSGSAFAGSQNAVIEYK